MKDDTQTESPQHIKICDSNGDGMQTAFVTRMWQSLVEIKHFWLHVYFSCLISSIKGGSCLLCRCVGINLSMQQNNVRFLSGTATNYVCHPMLVGTHRT